MLDKRCKTTVRILGKDYALTGDEPEEYIHKIAFYADKKMREISRRNPRLSTALAAVLSVINVIDELFKTEEYIEELKKQLIEKDAEVDKCRDDLRKMRTEIEEFRIRGQE